MDIISQGITILFSKAGSISILCGILNLSGGWPVIDGNIYRNSAIRVIEQNISRMIVEYDLGQDVGTFVLTVEKGVKDGPILQYAVCNVPLSRNFFNFGLHFDSVSGMVRYYRGGYNSWDGSYYVQPEGLRGFGDWDPRRGSWVAPNEQGYALTQLISQNVSQALVMGFDRHDRFQQTFTFDTHSNPPGLEILTLWDQKKKSDKRQCISEKLCLLQDKDYEEGLRRWARIVAAASPTPPRRIKAPIIGWCSWYDTYHFISEDIILDFLKTTEKVIKSEKLPMQVFQIDAGFTPQMGDWLLFDPNFPNGIKPIIKQIKKAGFKPGVWIAPFWVGNRSQLYQQHPDWVLRDPKTGEPKVDSRRYGEHRLWRCRSEEYFVLDTTHPEAFEYLRQVFRTWRKDWGAEYFKTDFMLKGAQWGPEDVIYHTPGMTRIEIWRRVAQMIRKEVGEDAIWLGCGQPLWASVGLVDGIRIGGDVGVSWTGQLSAQSLLRDQQTRNFANHILWQIDPDCVLLRTKYHYLSDIEVRTLALYAGMSGGVMMTSDNFSEVPPERIDLWKMILSTEKSSCRYPFLGRQDIRYVPIPGSFWGQPLHATVSEPLIVQVRDNVNGHIVHILNISGQRETRTYALSDLGINGKFYVWDRTAGQPWSEPVDKIQVILDSHESKLFFLNTKGYQEVPSNLAGW